MKINTYYEISDNPGSTYCQTGYSQYYKRLALRDAGKLRGEVYGLKQAIEHVAELRQSIYEGKKIRLHNTFQVRKVTVKTQVVKTLLAAVRGGK